MRRRGTRSARSRSCRAEASRPGRSGAASRSTTRARPARTSSPPARSTRRGPERRSSSLTRASITSGCGPTSCGRRRWRFNLFGDLAADLGLADRAVHTWWPDAPGTVCEVRFAHSPGRFDPAYLNSLRAFDAAFVLDLGDGTQGIVGVDVKYHEWTKPRDPEAEQPRAVPRGRREVGRLRGRGDRRGQGEVGARRDVARAPAAAVDAPARERHVDAGVATSSSTPPATRTSPMRAPDTERCSWTSRRSRR